MVGMLGFKPEQVQEPFFDKLGNTGTAFSLMMLVAALEDAKPGDKILLASYGDGADVLLLKVTDKIKNITGKWGMKRSLASKMIMRSQGDYLAYREFAASDPEKFGGASASVIARERDAIYALHGVKCLDLRHRPVSPRSASAPIATLKIISSLIALPIKRARSLPLP